MSAGPSHVDPRGPRFAAWVTTVVLAVVLVTGWWPLLAAQAVVFGSAVGGVLGYVTGLSALGVAATAVALAAAVRLARTSPRIPRSTQREQGAGLVRPSLILNAAFAFCLGCETYLLIRRFTPTKERALQ